MQHIHLGVATLIKAPRKRRVPCDPAKNCTLGKCSPTHTRLPLLSILSSPDGTACRTLLAQARRVF
jgi:hypothetical protein